MLRAGGQEGWPQAIRLCDVVRNARAGLAGWLAGWLARLARLAAVYAQLGLLPGKGPSRSLTSGPSGCCESWMAWQCSAQSGQGPEGGWRHHSRPFQPGHPGTVCRVCLSCSSTIHDGQRLDGQTDGRPWDWLNRRRAISCSSTSDSRIPRILCNKLSRYRRREVNQTCKSLYVARGTV